MKSFINIDRQDQGGFSKYPFSDDSTCFIQDVVFNPTGLYNLSLYPMQRIEYPCHFGQLSCTINRKTSQNLLIVNSTLRDASNNFVGTLVFQSKAGFSFIFDDKDCIIGQAVYTQQFVNNIYITTMYSFGGSVELAQTAFIINPMCMQAFNTTGCRTFILNGNNFTQDFTLQSTDNIIMVQSGDYTQVNCYGDYQGNTGKPIQTLRVVNGTTAVQYDIKNKELLLQPATQSDLRILTKDGIEFKGSTDV